MISCDCKYCAQNVEPRTLRRRNPERGVPRFDAKKRVPRSAYGKLGAQTHRKKDVEGSDAARTHLRKIFKRCRGCKPLIVKADSKRISGPFYGKRKTKAVDSWRQFFNHIVLKHGISLGMLALALEVNPRTIYLYATSQPYVAGTSFIKKLVYMFGSRCVSLSRDERGSSYDVKRWKTILEEIDYEQNPFAQNVERRSLRRYRRNSTKPKRQKCKVHRRRYCEECHQQSVTPKSATSDDWALSFTDERNLLTIRDHLFDLLREDSCVNFTKAFIGIGAHFGVKMEPLVVRVEIYNPAATDFYLAHDMNPPSSAKAPEDGFIVDIGARNTRGELLPAQPGKWPGHLVALIHTSEGPYLVDLSIKQAERPHKGILISKPIGFKLPPNFSSQGHTFHAKNANLIFSYTPFPRDKSFEKTPGWVRSHKEEIESFLANIQERRNPSAQIEELAERISIPLQVWKPRRTKPRRWNPDKDLRQIEREFFSTPSDVSISGRLIAALQRSGDDISYSLWRQHESNLLPHRESKNSQQNIDKVLDVLQLRNDIPSLYVETIYDWEALVDPSAHWEHLGLGVCPPEEAEEQVAVAAAHRQADRLLHQPADVEPEDSIFVPSPYSQARLERRHFMIGLIVWIEAGWRPAQNRFARQHLATNIDSYDEIIMLLSQQVRLSMRGGNYRYSSHLGRFGELVYVAAHEYMAHNGIDGSIREVFPKKVRDYLAEYLLWKCETLLANREFNWQALNLPMRGAYSAAEVNTLLEAQHTLGRDLTAKETWRYKGPGRELPERRRRNPSQRLRVGDLVMVNRPKGLPSRIGKITRLGKKKVYVQVKGHYKPKRYSYSSVEILVRTGIRIDRNPDEPKGVPKHRYFKKGAKTVCTSAVLAAFGIDACTYHYSGQLKLRCNILRKNGWAARSRNSHLRRVYKFSKKVKIPSGPKSVGQARKIIARINKDEPETNAWGDPLGTRYMIRVEKHALLLDYHGKTIVDTDPRLRDKRKVSDIRAVFRSADEDDETRHYLRRRNPDDLETLEEVQRNPFPIRCNICGTKYKNLPRHLKMTHELTLLEYIDAHAPELKQEDWGKETDEVIADRLGISWGIAEGIRKTLGIEAGSRKELRKKRFNLALEYMQPDHLMTTKIYIALTGVTRLTARNDLNYFVEQGFLTKDSTGGTHYFRLIKNNFDAIDDYIRRVNPKKKQGKIRHRRNPDDLERLDKIAKAREFYRETKNITETANIVGVSRDTIYAWARDLISTDADPRIAEARRLYQGGMIKYVKLARAVGADRGAVKRWVADLIPNVDPRKEEARRVYQEETTNMAEITRKISAQFGAIKRDVVIGWLTDLVRHKPPGQGRGRPSKCSPAVCKHTAYNQAVDLLENQLSLFSTEAAHLVGVEPSGLFMHISKYHQHLRIKNKEEILRREARRLYQKETTNMIEIARRLNIGVSRIVRWVKDIVSELDTRREEQKREARRIFRKETTNISEIARRVGFSRMIVTGWVEDLFPFSKKHYLRRRNPEGNPDFHRNPLDKPYPWHWTDQERNYAEFTAADGRVYNLDINSSNTVLRSNVMSGCRHRDKDPKTVFRVFATVMDIIKSYLLRPDATTVQLGGAGKRERLYKRLIKRAVPPGWKVESSKAFGGTFWRLTRDV